MTMPATHLIVEKPVWDPAANSLSWRGQLALRLVAAPIASSYLNEWERLGWVWAIPDRRGGAASTKRGRGRRHAIGLLKRSQRGNALLQFASVQGALLWWPAEWTTGRDAAMPTAACDAAHHPAPRPRPTVVAGEQTHLIVEKPIWDRQAGELSWGGKVIAAFTDRASVVAELLDEWELRGWLWVIVDPLGRDAIGDPTQSLRHAVYRLNEHQGERRAIHFAAIHHGLVCWYPAEWLT